MAHSPVAFDDLDDDIEADVPPPDGEALDLGEIAAFVWGRRMAFDLSAAEVAELADVAEEVVADIERGVDVGAGEDPQRPEAHDLAAVLLALDTRGRQVAEVLGDDEWAADVLVAMGVNAAC